MQMPVTTPALSFDRAVASPARLGADVRDGGTGFALFSGHAERVELVLYDDSGAQETGRADLPGMEGGIWHGFLPGVGPGQRYGYRVHGPIGPDAVHLCVDMRRLFAAGSAWEVPWMERILPAVEAICAHRPERTMFTRFIPPERPEEARGSWRRYYRKWEEMTRRHIGAEMVEDDQNLHGASL